MESTYSITTLEELYDLAAQLVKLLQEGDIVFLEGPLGAGKTTFVRGLLHALGYKGAVRSPTYNLIQTFDTHPRVMHADLYRVKSALGIGIEDYLETHLCFIEWPDRAQDILDSSKVWHVIIEFSEEGRIVHVRRPNI